jgi:simple sugar transport system ATP-binding protein
VDSCLGSGRMATLIKILSGFHQPDTGTIVSKGQEVHFSSPREARAHGIDTVYQDLALIGDLNVYHNMFLGREYHKRILGLKLLDNRKMRNLAKTYLDTLGIEIPSVNSTVDLLSGGQRQSVAVARSVYSSPTVSSPGRAAGRSGGTGRRQCLGADPEPAPATKRLGHFDCPQL